MTTAARCFRLARWMLGSCLIVSAISMPKVGLSLIGCLGDLVLLQISGGLIEVTWLLMVVAGVGLLAGWRWACLLVYVAAVYTLFRDVSDFSFIPFVPTLVGWLDTGGSASRTAVLVANGSFVVLVGGVHVWLTRTAAQRDRRPIKARRRTARALLYLSTFAVALPAGVFVVLAVEPRLLWWLSEFGYGVPFFLMLAIGGPALTLGGAGVAGSLWRLTSLRKAQSRVDNGSQDVGGVASGSIDSGERAEDGAETRGARGRYQFTLRSLLLAVSVVAVLSAIGTAVWANLLDPSRYNRHFHQEIAHADRIVVRDGGYNCCGPVDDDEILFEITDPREIAELRENLRFVAEQSQGFCLCSGYPGIDWYQGRTMIALTSVQHGKAIRWKGFLGDARLTEESARWLHEWMIRHGVGENAFL